MVARMNNNSLGDMLIRIKNASRARHRSLEVPYSLFGEKLAYLLKEKGYLGKVRVEGETPAQKYLKIDLKYQGKKAVINDLRQISKPGLRRYLKIKEMARWRRRTPSLVVLSTPKGLMSLKEARKKNIGGELLCEVW